MLIHKAIIVAVAINLGITSDQVEKAAVDYGLKLTDVYTKDNEQAVNAAAASLLSTYLLVTAQGDGGFSVTLNTDEIKNRIGLLAAASGGLFIVPAEFQTSKRAVRARFLW